MIKWVGGTIGIGGAVVGGYYGVEALTNHSIPVVVRNTIEKELKKQGYKALILTDDKWQERFNELKKGDKLTKLKDALQEAKGTEFLVTKDDDNKDGGKELKEWCTEVLDLEIEKVTTNKSIENAKAFCSELKTTTQASPSESSQEPGGAG